MLSIIQIKTVGGGNFLLHRHRLYYNYQYSLINDLSLSIELEKGNIFDMLKVFNLTKCSFLHAQGKWEETSTSTIKCGSKFIKI